MITNPHFTCAQVLDTLRQSGLNYTLNETPYSVYLTLRKKFIKEHLPTKITQSQDANENTNKGKDTSQLAKLQEAFNVEIVKHNATKHELSEMKSRVEKLHDINEFNTEESKKQHIHQVTLLSNLQYELAQEVDDHAQSERALKKLEERVECIQIELENEVKQKASVLEENNSLVKNWKMQNRPQLT